ncbi:endonuclease/exonuclease/phosphatase family protein [Acetobacteraceae bacterium H6797]|nr:endonuclease/exonuclease/phosphatase family protein [Acetobacteraceae bacterium H6797]
MDGREGGSAARNESLRVATYNLHKCIGADGRFNPARNIAVIAELGADIVAVQEVDKRFGRRTGLMDLRLLERETGLVPLQVSDLSDGHGWHGNALLIRPGIASRVHRMSLPGMEPRGALVVELDLPEGPLRVIAAHLGLLRRSRKRQAAAILKVIQEGTPMPTLLMGDLNEWRPGRRSSLTDLDDFFGPTTALPRSFPALMPLLPLDRIMGWPHGLVSGLSVHFSPRARAASDHLPLTGSLSLKVLRQPLEAPRLAEAA